MPALSPAKRDLWLRLKRYHFEHLVPAHLTDHVLACFGGADAATRAFANKLSRKLGWTPRFARRAIEEYRKFLYLGVVADFGVTPSKVIDQVWHEHLLFTKAYGEFCREVLGRPFEHYPELVATEDQTSVFQEQYERTLDLYEDEFNVTPPDDVWSTPKFRPGLARVQRALRKKKWDPATSSSSSSDDAPLYILFDGSVAADGLSADAMPEFGGGGGFSGGGGGGDWGDSFAGSFSSSHSDSGAGHSGGDSSGDSGGSDSGGGDSGGGDGGGSGCSSGCGGGGCGGGGE